MGSTGSVGCSTLDLISRNRDAFKVQALTASRRVDELAKQAIEVGAECAVIATPELYGDLKAALAGTGIEAAAGAEAVVEAADRPADLVLAAIVGAAGLKSTLAAVRRGATVALANKETLVCAGDLMIAEVAAHSANLLPVDSEHNAIFQVLDGAQPEAIEKIILTASGGPLRERSLAEMEKVTPEQAVAHPNWDMGAKISVDSATMMNKGLEVIEAHHLFDMPSKKIEVIVHPQSVIHSMVAYVDGSVLAQLGSPDMRTPIAYSLSWPKRMNAPVERLDFAKVNNLTFEAPDPVRFPALRLAREALEAGGAAPTVLNAANEIAVEAFLDHRLGFTAIAETVEATLDALGGQSVVSLDDVFGFDAAARAFSREYLNGRPSKPAKQAQAS
jgi:1-deoxy-D-xylulose-5-phosphate reductoisomerase